MSGSGELCVSSVAGRGAITRCWSHSPLRLLTPRSFSRAVWAYTSSFGGGMVAGDRIRLKVRIDADARCFLSTQSATKIYKNPRALPCSHELHAVIGEDALLVLAPDPVQCFANSDYEQRQIFELAPSANLVLVDWCSSGRAARGERWSFNSYFSRNEIHRGGSPVFMDPVLLENIDPANKFMGGRFNCLASVVILGPRLAGNAAAVLDEINREPVRRGADLIVTASPLAEGALLRLAGVSVEQTGRAIHRHLGFVRELLQDDPWARKW